MNSLTLLRAFCLSLPLACIGCKNQQHAAEPEEQKPQEVSLVAQPEEVKEDPGDLYYQAYLKSREGSSLSRDASNAKERELALQKFQESLDSFQAIKTKFPNWKSQMVDGRIELTIQQMAKLKQKE